MYGGSWLKRTLALLETMVPLWRWPSVVLVMSHRCFVKVMKSVRQEAGMWTTSSFEETTGISTTLCHRHFLRVRDEKYYETLRKISKFHQIHTTSIPSEVPTSSTWKWCSRSWNCTSSFVACISQGENHGETETERSERLFCPLKKHHIPITFRGVTLPGEREQFPPVKEARALRRPPRCFGAGHAFAELPALRFWSHHEVVMWPEKATNGYRLHSLRLLLQLLQGYRFMTFIFVHMTKLRLQKLLAFGIWTISSTSCQVRMTNRIWPYMAIEHNALQMTSMFRPSLLLNRNVDYLLHKDLDETTRFTRKGFDSFDSFDEMGWFWTGLASKEWLRYKKNLQRLHQNHQIETSPCPPTCRRRGAVTMRGTWTISSSRNGTGTSTTCSTAFRTILSCCSSRGTSTISICSWGTGMSTNSSTCTCRKRVCITVFGMWTISSCTTSTGTSTISSTIFCISLSFWTTLGTWIISRAGATNMVSPCGCAGGGGRMVATGVSCMNSRCENGICCSTVSTWAVETGIIWVISDSISKWST